MIVLYAVGLALLGVAAFVTARRARHLERKYVAAARAAERLAHDLTVKNGNRNHFDPCVNARNQYELGRVVHKRDRLEGRYAVWATRGERIARLDKRLRSWKGRYAPYLFGAVDAILVAAGLTWVGVLHMDTYDVIEKVRTALSR